MTGEPFDIVTRDRRFPIRENASRTWNGGDPILTAIADGFAVMLPVGERFFIQSIKPYTAAIEDPALREDIKAFSRQEAFHTREHEGYNAGLRDLGVDVDDMEKRALKLLERDPDPMVRLAVTCAIEQITYTFSRCLLQGKIFENAPTAYRQLWHWHALEEVEHASVALRVYHAAPWSGTRLAKYLVRVIVMYITVSVFVGLMMRNARTILVGPDGKMSWRMRCRFAWGMVRYPVPLRALVLPCLRYLLPGYAGGGRGDRKLIERGRRMLDGDIATA